MINEAGFEKWTLVLAVSILGQPNFGFASAFHLPTVSLMDNKGNKQRLTILKRLTVFTDNPKIRREASFS